MLLSNYLRLLATAESSLADAYLRVADAHRGDADVYYACETVSQQCREHADLLAPVMLRYVQDPDSVPDSTHAPSAVGTRSGGLALLRDLHDLYQCCAFVDASWMMVGQAARGLADARLLDVVTTCEAQTAVQLKWLRTAMKSAAPQALIVAS